jgi:hypothetical protein
VRNEPNFQPEIPCCSTVLSFYHSLPRLGGTTPEGWGTRGRNAQNEPNFSIADCGFRADLRRDAPCGLPRPVRGGQNVQNEPNSRRGRAGRATGMWGEGRRCTTKPLSGRTSSLSCETKLNSRPRRAGRGVGGVGRGTNAQNEPNSRRRRAGRGLGNGGRGVLYKQTQFQGRGLGPLPRPSGLAPPPNRLCETNPIRTGAM